MIESRALGKELQMVVTSCNQRFNRHTWEDRYNLIPNAEQTEKRAEGKEGDLDGLDGRGRCT